MILNLCFVSLMLLLLIFKFMLMILMMIELLVLNIAVLLYMIYSINSLEIYMIYYLIFSVCESVLGLMLLILVIRFYGNEYYFSMNLFKFKYDKIYFYNYDNNFYNKKKS